ncbi:MAG: helix-turn-helix transcriptional regulator [Pseudomonadota bacterium]|nr:helix-turn-helix transcriptional regulator [Pseudomonadota bacterium]
MNNQDEMKRVGKRLSQERKRLGFNRQEKFADLCNVSLKTQSFYESGRTAPHTEYWLAIIKLGVDIQYVMTGVRSVKLGEDIEDYDFLSIPREDVQRLRDLVREQMRILK